MWSNYFKIKILRLNSRYKENIEIFNKFKIIKIKRNNSKTKNIIFLQEKIFQYFIFKLGEEFKKSRKYTICFKPRQNQVLDEKIFICKKNNIKIYDNISFEDLINKKKFHAVIGANSQHY